MIVDTNTDGINMIGDQLSLVVQWTEAMGERGLFDSNTARFKITALHKICSILGPEEPHTVEYVLENVADLARRWMIKERANPATGRTYETRCKTLLESYLAYQENPSSFKPRSRSPKEKIEQAPKDVKGTATKVASSTDQSPPPPVQPTTAERLRRYRLECGEDFAYEQPPLELTTKDAIKIFYHLVTMAVDFDPTDPNIAKILMLGRSN